MSIKDNIQKFKFNPAAMQEAVLDDLSAANGMGISFVDPSNPFIALMETTLTAASETMAEIRSETRKLYPKLAVSFDELYHHMSDADYLNRFALPTDTTVTLVIDVDELIKKAIPYENGLSSRLVIPGNAVFKVQNYTFGIEYPIIIKVLSNKSFSVVWDGEYDSPLIELESNYIKNELVWISNINYLRITIPVKQFTITPHYSNLNPSVGYKEVLPFADKFYYCRVFMRDNTSSPWNEINTTHSKLVYDNNEVTALLRVVEQEVEVTIPQIYFNTGKAVGEVRVDVYTTNGKIVKDLKTYISGEWSATWRDLNGRVDALLSAPLNTFSNMGIYSDDLLVGGRDSVDFNEFRRRVIYNSAGITPSTPTDISYIAENNNLEIVPIVDNITDRVYHSTNTLPAPSGTASTGAIGVEVTNSIINIDSIIDMESVYNNGWRVTIGPETLFKSIDGIINVVTDDGRRNLESIGPDELVRALNGENYRYTPFHYVMDVGADYFNVRPYYLDDPKLVSRNFEQANDELEFYVGSNRISLKRTMDSYIMEISVKGGENYNNLDISRCHLQLSFVPKGETDRVSLNGTYVGNDSNDNRVYRFTLTSNFDVDNDDYIGLEAFSYGNNAVIPFFSPLQNVFDLVYVVTGYTTEFVPSEIDGLIDGDKLPEDAVGVTHERLTLSFGDAMGYMRCNSRTVVSSKIYKRYLVDVPAYYKNTVFKYDENGHIEYEIDDEGNIDWKILHQKGDPIYDSDGKRVYLHKAGDVKLDSLNRPIIESGRSLERHVELFLMDGLYRYVTEPVLASYVASLPRTVLGYLDLVEANSEGMAPRTKTYYSPKRTLGMVDVTVENGEVLTIPSEITFIVDYYLSEVDFEDNSLKTSILETTKQVLGEVVNAKTISITQISFELKERVSGSVIDINVKPLGPNNNLDVFSIISDGDRCSIARNVEILADNTIQVVDDVRINFFKHVL